MVKLTFISALLFAFLFTHFSHSQVIVTPGSFPNSCQGAPGYIMQTSPIIIKETLPTDFGINTGPILYNLQFPAGYQMWGSGFTVAINSGDIVNFNYQAYVNGILISYDCPTQTKIDIITISGIQLQVQLASPTNINLVRTAAPTNTEAPQNDNMVADAQNHATLVSTYPPPGFVPIISIAKTFFCTGDNTLYPVTVNPTGGYFTAINGLIGTNFQPSAANVFYPSGVTLRYNYNYMSCPFYAFRNLSVQMQPYPVITDDDADNTICPGQTVTFTGTPKIGGNRYQFLKNGVSMQGPSYTQNTYTTTSLANGDVISFIMDTGPGSCSTEVTDAAFTVINIPTPSVSFPTLPALICSNNTGSFAASLNPSGGTISGAGISGNNFNPSLAALGSNVITYAGTYMGCSYSTTATVSVTAAPTVTISSSDADNIICKGDSVTFSANTLGTASRYLFIKNGNGIQGPNANNTYLTATLADGDAISVIVDNGSATCPATSSDIVTAVGKYPKANFDWGYACGSSHIDFQSSSTIPSGSSIVTYKWDFENNGILFPYNLNYSAYNYPTYGTYHAKLTVISDKGCRADTLIKVYTTPSIVVTPSDPYIVNFSTSDQSWASDGKNSSWGWGAAPAAFGLNKNVWSTGQNASHNYNAKERSYLYGPCLQMYYLYKPMIALKLSSRIPGKLAGTILEASTDNGTNWEKVGTINLGQNWYNKIGIASTPSTLSSKGVTNNATSEGWTDDLSSVVARFDLQKYAGMVNVRIRLNFASVSDSTVPRGAGFALDSVFIGQRNKMVLLEHFTNDPNTDCIAADPILSNIETLRKNDLVALNYHTSFPKVDQFNLLNTSDPSARVLFYGVSGTPNSYLNGTINSNNYDGTKSGIQLDTNLIDAKSLDPAKFKIEISNNISYSSNILNPGDLTTNTRITYLGNSAFSAPIAVQIAIVEDLAIDKLNNVRNKVLMKMLPDAGGNYFSQTWNENDFYVITQSWSDNAIQTGKKIGVIVFIQNIGTREVYQSAILKGNGDLGQHVIATIENTTKENISVTIYPNPASDKVNVVYGNIVTEDYYWELYNSLGRLVETGISKKGTQIFTLNTSALSDGTYYLRIITNNDVITNKLFVVK